MIRLLTEEGLYHAAAEEVCRIGQLSQQLIGRFSFVLSGGSTPRRLYQLLAERPYRAELDWTKVEFFWGDERAVPADHPSSNFRMAREAMLDKLGVPAERIHRIDADHADDEALDEAARRYEADIDRVLGRVAGAGRRPPHFNLFLLGMGEDGHTASLFPGTKALDETQRWVVAHDVPAVGKRITMTPPLINAAHFIIFLVAGAAKADVLAQVLQGARDPHRCPAQLIRPLTGEVTWMIDRAASTSLVQHQRKES